MIGLKLLVINDQRRSVLEAILLVVFISRAGIARLRQFPLVLTLADFLQMLSAKVS